MKTAKFSKLERRVGQIASRRAHRQLMQVPWHRFHKAYEEYIRWQAFVLWARAVVESEGIAPSWLKAILRKRCPGFVEEVDRSNKTELLGLQLLLQVPTIKLPANIALELGQQSPSLLEFVRREMAAGHEDKSRSWKRLFNWGKDHVLSHAKKEGWLDCVLRQAGIHPRHVRLVDYSALWCKSRRANTALPYPHLRQWQRNMEGYVRAGRK